MNSLKALLTIVIICINHNKRGINHIFRRKHSLTGSPRLCPTFWHSSRNIVNILESIVNSYIMRGANRVNTITDNLFELFLDILADDKYHMIKSCFDCIMDGIVHNDMVSIINRLQLLNSRSKSAADTSCHDK